MSRKIAERLSLSAAIRRCASRGVAVGIVRRIRAINVVRRMDRGHDLELMDAG